MTLRPEDRTEWILAHLEGDGLPEGLAPPGNTEMDRSELAREAAGCRETWRALGKLDERIASETPSPRVHSAFQAQLADAILRESAQHPSRSRLGGFFGRVPSLRSGVLAAATAMVALAVFALWRSAVWPPRAVPATGAPTSVSVPSLDSASNRLGAVLTGFGKNGTATIGELGRALESDSNPNVRLAALTVLAEQSNESGLEGRIARALAKESDPLVRLELIRTIGERRLVQDATILRDLAHDPRLDDLARDEIARVMTRLGS